MLESKTYSYTDSEWIDRLTKYNGHSITYDNIGNPLSYYNGSTYTFTWNGRELATAVKGSTSISYQYGADGLRTQKTVGSTVYNYYYADGLLIRQTWGTNYIDFLYDESGNAYSFVYNGTQYYYVRNLQGDVLQILNASGSTVGTYSYDSWGKVTASGSIAQINPIRYRGYYYDTETGFYYLQSRYYDPAIKRFINADDVSLLGANGDFTSLNLYAYCGNNPIMNYDPYGYAWYHNVWNACKKIGSDTLQLVSDVRNIIASNITLEAGICIGMDVAIGVNGADVDIGTRMDIVGFALEEGKPKFGHFGKSGASVSAGDYAAGYESRTYESFDGVGDYATGMQQVNPSDKGHSFGKSAVFVIGYHYRVGFSISGTISDLIDYFR